MILDETNYREVITGYTRDDWRPMLELIPEIESMSSFGEVIPAKVIEEGLTTLPYMRYHDVVVRFVGVCYEIPVMVNFDWGGWLEGDCMLRDHTYDYNLVDVPEKCRLLTALVRADRFSEGSLVAAFESGVVLRILKAMERQILSG